jgi:hypothetical protein
MRKLKELNEKHKEFCRQLLKTKFNATEAYQLAYPNCGREAARREGAELLSNPDIEKYIKSLVDKEEEETMVTVKEVIKGIKTDIDKAHEYHQISASLKGRELLGKYLKMFTDNVELSGKDGNPISQKITIEFVDAVPKKD